MVRLAAAKVNPHTGVARDRKGGLNGEMRKTLRTPTMQSSRSRHWTPEEDAVLREFYPGQGAAACAARLPHRGLGSIAYRAAVLGLTASKGPSQEQRGGRGRYSKEPNPERAMRRCLGPCGELFVSEWVGHRMCKACRRHAERIGGDSGAFTPPSGRASAGGWL